MICIIGDDAVKAKDLAESIRIGFNEISFKDAGRQTISAGVTLQKQGDTAETMCIRADDALYLGKRNGKNKVVVL